MSTQSYELLIKAKKEQSKENRDKKIKIKGAEENN